MFDAQEFMALAIVAIVAAYVVWRQWLGPVLRPASRARKASGSCSGCASARPPKRRPPDGALQNDEGPASGALGKGR